LFDEENFLIAVDCKKLSHVDKLPVNIQVKSDFSLISEFSSKNKKWIEKTKKVFHRSLFLIESFTFLCSLNNFKESGFFISVGMGTSHAIYLLFNYYFNKNAAIFSSDAVQEIDK